MEAPRKAGKEVIAPSLEAAAVRCAKVSILKLQTAQERGAFT